jgi:hypothetical protein
MMKMTGTQNNRQAKKAPPSEALQQQLHRQQKMRPTWAQGL